MTDKRYKLSRRKALAGLATVGAAGAASGLVTSALFSDTESFTNNSLTAGEMDLTVEVELVDINPETQANGLKMAGSDLANTGDTITINGDESSDIDGGMSAGADLIFDDVKPGDWWVLKTAISVDGNPAYVGAGARSVSDSDPSTAITQSENGTTDPEPSTPTPDLGQKLRVRVGDRYVDSASAGINPGDADRKNVQQGWLDPTDSERAGNNTPATVDYTPPKDISLPNDDGGIRFGDNGYDNDVSSQTDIDNGNGPETSNPLDLVFVGTLNHRLWGLRGFLDQKYSDPEVGDGDPTTPDIQHLDYGEYAPFVNPNDNLGGIPTSGNNNPIDGVSHAGPGVSPGFGSPRNSQDYTTLGTQNNPDAEEICTYAKYFVPSEVENEIQGDSISFSLEYIAEQARNNDQPSWIPS